jgi:hypothetical protein
MTSELTELIYDFYFLDFLRHEIKDHPCKKGVEDLHEMKCSILGHTLLSAGIAAIDSELSHLWKVINASDRQRFIDTLSSKQKNFMLDKHPIVGFVQKNPSYRNKLLPKLDFSFVEAITSKMSYEEFFEMSERAFLIDSWSDSYGGKMWHVIVRAIKDLNFQLHKAYCDDLIRTIDTVISAEHNTGALLTKTGLEEKEIEAVLKRIHECKDQFLLLQNCSADVQALEYAISLAKEKKEKKEPVIKPKKKRKKDMAAFNIDTTEKTFITITNSLGKICSLQNDNAQEIEYINGSISDLSSKHDEDIRELKETLKEASKEILTLIERSKEETINANKNTMDEIHQGLDDIDSRVHRAHTTVHSAIIKLEKYEARRADDCQEIKEQNEKFAKELVRLNDEQKLASCQLDVMQEILLEIKEQTKKSQWWKFWKRWKFRKTM